MHIKSEAEFLVKQEIIQNLMKFESIKGLAPLCTATARHHCIDVLVYAFPWHTNLQRIDSQVAHLSFIFITFKTIILDRLVHSQGLRNNEILKKSLRD